jgi:hypothetical protein
MDKEQSIQTLLKVLQAAQLRDPEALKVLNQYRTDFKKALPILEERLRSSAGSGEDDPRTGYKHGDGIEDVVSGIRELVFSDEKPDPEVPATPAKPPAPAPKMDRMKVVAQKSVGNPPPEKQAMPNTVLDPYGHPIDSPAQQTGPLDDPNEINARVADGQKKQDYLRGQYAKAANPAEPVQLVSEEPAMEPDKAMALQLLKSIFTLSGKPVK